MTTRMMNGQCSPFAVLLMASLASFLNPSTASAADGEAADGTATVVVDPASVGGEAGSVVQVANLIYAGTKTSECFSDHFLRRAESDSAISTSRRLHSVKLSSEEIFNFPMLVMTGEGEFELLESERENLRQFIERGGFLLASSGCSSEEWDRSFRKAVALTFQNKSLETLTTDHLIFHTVYDIESLEAKHGTPKPLVGIHFGTRLGVLYSQDGLNDTSNTQGCCCCGGNEITNAEEINVNILVYSLLQ